MINLRRFVEIQHEVQADNIQALNQNLVMAVKKVGDPSWMIIPNWRAT